ncbi:MAG: hypothetical protein PHG69_06395 [Candidatus Omnitrophica bacterium]|nr:hypothetical protein [Candidatus Omnitrophota bacterium]
MNDGIKPEIAIKKIDEYLKRIDELFKKSYDKGIPERNELNERIQGFVSGVFKDDDKKLREYKEAVNFYVNSSKLPSTEKQRYYELRLKIMRNKLLAFKDELSLFLESKETSGQLTKIEKQTKEVEDEVKRRKAVVDEKVLGSIIELLTIQREELKRKGIINNEIVEIKKGILDIKSMLEKLDIKVPIEKSIKDEEKQDDNALV